LQFRGKELCYRKVYSAARGKAKGSRRSFVKRTRPQQPSEGPERHGAVTAAIMITESHHYYECTEGRDLTQGVAFPSLFSQSANEHRACGCTGRGKKKKGGSRQARGNTNTKEKRKQTKALRMISTAYNNVAACKNL
jgi:hypothetical protein